MKAYLYFLKRGKPREEDWLDRKLLSSGELLEAKRREIIFRLEDVDPLKSLELPATMVIENPSQSEKLYLLCNAFFVGEGEVLHLFGKPL